MTNKIIKTLILALALPSPSSARAAFASPKPTVTDLLGRHSSAIAELKTQAASLSSEPPSSDVFYLRYCLAEDEDDESPDLESIKSSLAENMKWRSNEGKSIVDSARAAVAQATSGDSWDNAPVRDAAPHADVINKFISTSQILTTTSRPGDLVYCIRAGKIDDATLMSSLSVDQMIEFFLYAKEIHSLVADERSEKTNALVRVVTCNDLHGVKLIGGSKDFRNALSGASKKATSLYPNLAGVTLLLNLPALVGALVKVFTPLFPEKVRRRLKFEKGPLKDVEDLKEVGNGGSERDKFLDQLDNLAY